VAHAVPLPSGDDTINNMAIKGPVVQSVPKAKTLLILVLWTADRTKDSVLTIQDSKTRKFIAEIRRPDGESDSVAESAADIWVDKCFAESGRVCGGKGIRFAGTPATLQDMIVQRIQQTESESPASTGPQALSDPAGSTGG
jgi:hypothetical protein